MTLALASIAFAYGILRCKPVADALQGRMPIANLGLLVADAFLLFSACCLCLHVATAYGVRRRYLPWIVGGGAAAAIVMYSAYAVSPARGVPVHFVAHMGGTTAIYVMVAAAAMIVANVVVFVATASTLRFDDISRSDHIALSVLLFAAAVGTGCGLQRIAYPFLDSRHIADWYANLAWPLAASATVAYSLYAIINHFAHDDTPEGAHPQLHAGG
ncbi:hypothetical protein AB0H76_13145 [Nocardia sp. NPDC050712]|uniref:hypothetical protein n=1 Tax=Nocardia sp. NPDC050712 TaxID=3155518 RepID=UPI003408C03C